VTLRSKEKRGLNVYVDGNAQKKPHFDRMTMSLPERLLATAVIRLIDIDQIPPLLA